MNRIQAGHMPAHFNRYKNMVVDDVLPTSTSRLHNRLFAWTRRKHIAVKDEDSTALNAYLINPAYIDQSVVLPAQKGTEPSSQHTVIQYSQITRPSTSRPSFITGVGDVMTRVQQSLSHEMGKIVAFAGAIAARSKTFFKGANTYTIQHGARKAWSRRLATFATALTLMGAGSIPFIISENDPGSITEQGSSQTSTSSNGQDQSIRTSSSQVTIPLFSNEPSVIASEVPNQSSSANADQRSVARPMASPSYDSSATYGGTDQTLVQEQNVEPAPITESNNPILATPEPAPEPLPIAPIEDITEPVPFVEDVTYVLNNTVTNTTETITDTTGQLGL